MHLQAERSFQREVRTRESKHVVGRLLVNKPSIWRVTGM